MSAVSRLYKEYGELMKEQAKDGGDAEISLEPVDEENIYEWRASISGPPGTPYGGGRFELLLQVPESYPLVPPKAKFTTTVFHANVHFKTGEICLDILKKAWTPAFTLQAVCRSIQNLLSDPDASSPLNCDAGNLLRSGDRRGFDSMASMYTEMYSKPLA